MTTPNLPNGTMRSDFPYNLCRQNCPSSLSNTSENSPMASALRTAFNTLPNITQPKADFLDKSTACVTSNLLTPNNLIQSNTSNFGSHPAFNTIFQTLLRGSSQPNHMPMPPANVSGYLHNVPNQRPTGPVFTNPQHNPVVCQNNAHTNFSVPAGQCHGISTGLNVPVTRSTCNPSRTAVHHTLSKSIESLFLKADSSTGSNDKAFKTSKKIDSMTFIRWAATLTASFSKDTSITWPRQSTDNDILHNMNWIIAPPGLLGIYSESPFLCPVLSLRRVQFASPGNVNPNIPDPDNMVQSLREMANSKVINYSGFSTKPPNSAASVGFATDFMTYVFTLELERHVVRLLTEQLRFAKRPNGPDWRVILRLGWATTDFYVPDSPAGGCSNRALVLESLPRCLSVRVVGRTVSLPDPIFHGGQAQKLGKRLRLSVDITDKIPIKPNTPVRNRIVDIEITWLHAPLEDQSKELLNMVATGQLSPYLCHLVGLPLVQVTLDRAYSIGDLCSMFDITKPVPQKLNHEMPFPNCSDLPLTNSSTDGLGPLQIYGALGAYDNCLIPTHILPEAKTKSELKCRFAKIDSDISIIDEGIEVADYIPICLLCPLTRTRITLPVRSCNCSHLQCFDLHSYLTINYRRPRWTCPLCNSPVPFRDLRIDELFLHILQDPLSKDAEFVRIDSDGNWHLPSTNQQSGSAKLIGGSLSPTNAHVQEITNANSNVINDNTTTDISDVSIKRASVIPTTTTTATTTATTNALQTADSLLLSTKIESQTPKTDVLGKDESEPMPVGAISNVEDLSSDPDVIVLSDDDDDDNDQSIGSYVETVDANVRQHQQSSTISSFATDDSHYYYQHNTGCNSSTNNNQRRNISSKSLIDNRQAAKRAATNTNSLHDSDIHLVEVDLTADDSDESIADFICKPNQSNKNEGKRPNLVSNVGDCINDFSTDFVRARDQLITRDPMIVISPLSTAPVTELPDQSGRHLPCNSQLINHNETTKSGGKQLRRIGPTHNTLMLAPDLSTTSSSPSSSSSSANLNIHTHLTSNVRQETDPRYCFYQQLLERTAQRVNETMSKKCARSNEVQSKVPPKRSVTLKKNHVKQLNTSRPTITGISDSEDDFLSDNSIEPDKHKASFHRPAATAKERQSVALARLVQQRAHRVVHQQSNPLQPPPKLPRPNTSTSARRSKRLCRQSNTPVSTSYSHPVKSCVRKTNNYHYPSDYEDDDEEDSELSQQSRSQRCRISTSDSMSTTYSEELEPNDGSESTDSSSDDRWSPSRKSVPKRTRLKRKQSVYR